MYISAKTCFGILILILLIYVCTTLPQNTHFHEKEKNVLFNNEN
jgi:hypothetical protein